MKTVVLLILILFINKYYLYSQEEIQNNSDFPILKGQYLGQGSPGTIPEIFAPDIISTDKGELNPMFSPNGNEFYFTVEVIPGVSYVAYYMQTENDIWTEPKLTSFYLDFEGGEPSFSTDGEYLFFGSMLNENGIKQNNVDLWKINKLKNSNAIKLGINSEFHDAYPTLSEDNTLYFHSNREGGKGAVDIYYSTFENEGFNTAVNIGDSINSQYPEFHPCISKKGNFIIFTSLNRPDGEGDLDLYISFRKKDGKWTTAKNLGAKINSDKNDYMPYISYDGKYLFFTSTRTFVSTESEQEESNNKYKNILNGKPNIFWVDIKFIENLR